MTRPVACLVSMTSISGLCWACVRHSKCHKHPLVFYSLNVATGLLEPSQSGESIQEGHNIGPSNMAVISSTQNESDMQVV